MNEIQRFLFGNLDTVKGFGIVYLLTFIPAWVIVYLIGKELAKKRSGHDGDYSRQRLKALIVLEAAILAAPYLYAIVFVDGVPTPLKAILLIALLVVCVLLLRKKEKRP